MQCHHVKISKGMTSQREVRFIGVCHLLSIPLLDITVIIGIGKETPVVDTIDILLHRRVIQRQAKSRSQKWITLRVRGLQKGLLSGSALEHGGYCVNTTMSVLDDLEHHRSRG